MATTKKTAAKKTPAETNEPARYAKASLVASKRFADNRDLLSAVLEDGKSYSIAECTELINNYMKGMVD